MSKIAVNYLDCKSSQTRNLWIQFWITKTTSSATPQRKSLPKKEVKVYFYHGIGEYIDLSPVTRVVNEIAPARAAI
jgi:hypothetical protein